MCASDRRKIEIEPENIELDDIAIIEYPEWEFEQFIALESLKGIHQLEEFLESK